MKKFFAVLAFITSVLIASSAAYYSVFGLSHLFAGAKLAIIIMAGSLEFGKLVTATILHRYWEDINKGIRLYLLIGTITLIGITSAGIYGFLSNAYQITANQYAINSSQINILENKKNYFQKNIDRIGDQVTTKENRINTLTELRAQQEARLDTLYKKQWWNSIRRTEALIKQADAEIKKNSNDITELNNNISSSTDSINKFDMQILGFSNSESTADLGPLIYLSKITGKSMDQVVNYFILLLIFVFDPLAVCLLIAANTISLKAFKKTKNPVATTLSKTGTATKVEDTHTDVLGEHNLIIDDLKFEATVPDEKEFNTPYPLADIINEPTSNDMKGQSRAKKIADLKNKQQGGIVNVKGEYRFTNPNTYGDGRSPRPKKK